MPISIAGSGTITGISAGGLPDDCITTAEIAANAVTTAKLGSAEASGLCKAWVNFNGSSTVAIRASYNVSSITDNGTGDYTVNFTTALADANYSLATGGTTVAGVTTGIITLSTNSSGVPLALTSSTCRIICSETSTGVPKDVTYLCLSFFR